MLIDDTLVFIFILAIFAALFIFKAVRVVPQQEAWVVERFGKFHCVLDPGLNFIIPVMDRVAYRMSLKEVPLDTDSQVCITKDNTQLSVDGVLFYQVTDPRLASYGTSNFVLAITQLAQTSLRSIIGTMALDQTFEERDKINAKVVAAIDEAATNWGVKVLRYEIKDLTPPASILQAMQLQITSEREKRAVIAESEGKKQQAINLAEGKKRALIAESEGQRDSAINEARGKAEAVRVVAEAEAEAIRVVAKSIIEEGGINAINLQIAQKYVQAFGNIAKEGNTLIVPSNLTDVSSLLAASMNVIKAIPSDAAKQTK